VYLSVDDTDSPKGLCTTFLATEIIGSVDLDLIGYPRLVRLNPAVPWKTRGNGSLSLKFGYGTGKKIKIGRIKNRDIFCFEKQKTREPDPKELLDSVIPITEKFRQKDSDSGLIVSSVKPSRSFYTKGVRTIVKREEIDKEIKRIGALTHTWGNGRGLTGSLCGMAWRPGDRTFELIAYRPEKRWGTERIFDSESIGRMDSSFSSTFNSWEPRFHKVAMIPATPCPVMYGLRGDDPSVLFPASETVVTEDLERKMIFLTNQGTDDHIIRNPKIPTPMSSYYIEGTVKSVKRIEGGHVFVTIETKYGKLECAAYEPSKEFRYLFDWLCPGDSIGVMGELREEPRTLNIEKVKVISVVPEISKISNPVCPGCGKTMESVGKDKGYRCRRCRTFSEKPVTEEKVRQVVPGWYEPPVAARRHLSKPLKRMGVCQPVEFVNGRT
jgi:tRNA(Ile2)-agmatinylcytidine synthase